MIFTLHKHTGTHIVLNVNPACAVLFSVTIITGFNSREMGLLQMIKEIAEFHRGAFVF